MPSYTSDISLLGGNVGHVQLPRGLALHCMIPPVDDQVLLSDRAPLEAKVAQRRQERYPIPLPSRSTTALGAATPYPPITGS